MLEGFSLIKVERDGHLATVTINRPEKLNALNTQVMKELLRAFHGLIWPQDGQAPRAAIFTGSGEKAFIAGADIAEMAELNASDAKIFSDLGHRIGNLMESAPFPIIAAVNGFALGGGCEFALMCDFIYASNNAKFGQPEVGLGAVPGFGGSQRLVRRVGIAKARELIYTGDTINADEAKRIGLANEVIPAAELMSRVRQVAEKIASKGPLAVASAKRLMLRGADQDLLNANELEANAFGVLFGTADQREGMAAFLQKRKPEFVGS